MVPARPLTLPDLALEVGQNLFVAAAGKIPLEALERDPDHVAMVQLGSASAFLGELQPHISGAEMQPAFREKINELGAEEGTDETEDSSAPPDAGTTPAQPGTTAPVAPATGV